MADEQTANEVYKDHVARFGPDLGPVYNALWSDLASLSAKWQEYRAMFATRSERVDLLNSAAGFFSESFRTHSGMTYCFTCVGSRTPADRSVSGT
jgi:hypothetical protein